MNYILLIFFVLNMMNAISLPKRIQTTLSNRKNDTTQSLTINDLNPHFINEPIIEDLNMNNNKIINIENGNENDAINKKYVDNNFLKKDEEIDMKNKKIINVKDPILPTDCANKKFVVNSILLLNDLFTQAQAELLKLKEEIKILKSSKDSFNEQYIITINCNGTQNKILLLTVPFKKDIDVEINIIGCYLKNIHVPEWTNIKKINRLELKVEIKSPNINFYLEYNKPIYTLIYDYFPDVKINYNEYYYKFKEHIW